MPPLLFPVPAFLILVSVRMHSVMPFCSVDICRVALSRHVMKWSIFVFALLLYASNYLINFWLTVFLGGESRCYVHIASCALLRISGSFSPVSSSSFISSIFFCVSISISLHFYCRLWLSCFMYPLRALTEFWSWRSFLMTGGYPNLESNSWEVLPNEYFWFMKMLARLGPCLLVL